MSTITKKINEIIDRRKGTGAYEGKGRLNIIEQRKLFFEKLKITLSEYESFRVAAISQIDGKQGEYYVLSAEDPSLEKRLEETATHNVSKQVEACIGTCNRLFQRFNRDSINISVVGRARQGKSTLLQRISGLDASVIPASDGGDCTGTTSIICNEPGTRTAHATVVFYSKEEILQQLRDYIREMKQNWVIPSFETIKSSIETYINTPEKQRNIKAGMTSAEQSLFMHFCKYINHFELYAQFIGDESREMPITEEQISQYVAQRDANQEPIFNFLAVKEVHIFKEFNYPDAGKIVLVDTIGLGDTALGIEKKMLQTLHNESDAAFLMRFPASTGDHWAKEDDELYQLIANEMGEEMLEKWLFLVINCKRNGETNNTAVTAVKQDVSEKVLRMAGIYETDCYSEQDVINTLLVPALDYLSSNLDAVDCRLMEQANLQFNACYEMFLAFYNKVSELITGSSKVIGELETFGITKFDQLYPQITGSIGKIHNDYRDNSIIPSGKMKKVIDERIEQLYDFVPNRKDILKRLEALKALPAVIFDDFLKEMSVKIAANFETINTVVLHKMQEMLKRRVAFELFETALWKSIPLVGVSNDKPTTEWLRVFAHEKLKDRFPLLYEAVNFILDYEMSVSDLLDYEVERCLMVITPGDPKCMPLDTGLLIKDGRFIPIEAQAKVIQNAIVNRIPDVNEQMQGSFNLMKIIPNHSLFARIRKFRDKLFMTQAAERELRNFYLQNASAIWGDEFISTQKIQSSQKLFAEWKSTMSALCRKASFTFELAEMKQN